jgi:type I restriction enzyme M protein
VARAKKKATKKAETAANVGYEAQPWQVADALRGSMDVAEYKNVDEIAPQRTGRSPWRVSLV